MFVQMFLPYVKAENEQKLDIWYVDEAGFNINQHPTFGWSLKGKVPICTVPIKTTNTSLLMAINKEKGSYF